MFRNYKQYYLYILTNKVNTVFYVGVTDDLIKRVYQHINKLVAGFTQKYNITKLVYYEIYNSPLEAIIREKQIKGGSRKDKIKLIESKNPNYKDLFRLSCLPAGRQVVPRNDINRLVH